MRETFWFVLPTLYLYYCLEWKHSVSACRISGDLAPDSTSLTLFKIYCLHNDSCAQPLSSFSSFSFSLHLFLPPPFFTSSHASLSVLLQDSEKKGFMNKLYAIQDVCISVQNALDEVASYGERIKKWVVSLLLGNRPASLCSSVFLHCQVAPLLLSAWLNKSWCGSQEMLPVWDPTLRRAHTVAVFSSRHPVWPHLHDILNEHISTHAEPVLYTRSLTFT